MPATTPALVACPRAEASALVVIRVGGTLRRAFPRLQALDAPGKLRVDLTARIRFEQRVNLAAHHHPLVQWNGAVLADDDSGITAHGAQPTSKLLRVRHGGGEANDGDVFIKIEDDLLPDCTTRGVRKEVDLIHDYVGKPL